MPLLIKEPGPFKQFPDGYCDEAGGVIGNGYILGISSCYYAFHILTGLKEGARSKAFKCLRAVIDAQIVHPMPDVLPDPRGTWRQCGTPGSGGKIDPNYADFIGTNLLQIFRHDTVPDHTDWPDNLYRDLIECLKRAVDCTIRRDLRLSYTNPTAMAIELMSLTGEMLGIPEYIEQACIRVTGWKEFTDRAGGFEEFNSNTYGGVTLPHIATCVEFVKDPDIKEKALYMEQNYFDHICAFYHRPTNEVCMPRARAYHDRLRGTLLHSYLCQIVKERRPDQVFDPEWDGTFNGPHYRAWSHAEEEQLDRLLDTDKSTETVLYYTEWIGQDHVGPLDQIPPKGNGDNDRRRFLTACMTEDFCIGSVNEIDSWYQRRALGGYIRTGNGSAMVSWKPKVEVKEEDQNDLRQVWPVQMYFSLCTGQKSSFVISGITGMPIDAGWLCGSHWRQKVEGLVKHVSVDFGFELEGVTGYDEPELNTPWKAYTGDSEITIMCLGGHVGEAEADPAIFETENGVRLSLLKRDDFELVWNDPPETGIAFILAFSGKDEQIEIADTGWSIKGTEFTCKASVNGEKYELKYNPPGIDKLTSQACCFG
jgi:hypothetical protein